VGATVARPAPSLCVAILKRGTQRSWDCCSARDSLRWACVSPARLPQLGCGFAFLLRQTGTYLKLHSYRAAASVDTAVASCSVATPQNNLAGTSPFTAQAEAAFMPVRVLCAGPFCNPAQSWLSHGGTAQRAAEAGHGSREGQGREGEGTRTPLLDHIAAPCQLLGQMSLRRACSAPSMSPGCLSAVHIVAHMPADRSTSAAALTCGTGCCRPLLRTSV